MLSPKFFMFYRRKYWRFLFADCSLDDINEAMDWVEDWAAEHGWEIKKHKELAVPSEHGFEILAWTK